MHNSENIATVKVLFNEGNQLRKEGKLAEAIEKYSEAVQVNPDYIPALQGLIKIYESRKEFDKAIPHWQRLVELMPKNIGPHLRLANLMMRQRNIPGAIAAYQKAVTLKPEQPGAYIGLAKVLNQNGQVNEAIAAYQKAIEISPELFPSIYQQLKEAWQKQERLDLDDAIAVYQKAIEIEPDNPAVYRLLAKSQARKGDVDEAIASYQKAIELQPDPPLEFRQSLANTLLQHEDIYLHIWNTLNQTNLDNFDNARFCYPTDISQEAASRYFTRQSKYNVIDLQYLTQEDRRFIKRAGLSLKYIWLTCHKLITKEGVTSQKSSRFNHNIERQLSMVQEDCIYALCPITGRTISSNCSLLFTPKFCFYRFVSNEVFYLISNSVSATLYFPRQELIVRTANRVQKSMIDEWKSYIVTNWKKIGSYLRSSERAKTVAVVGIHPSTFHSLVDDLSGIQMLYETGNLKKIDKYLIFNGLEYYGGIDEIFPEINSEKVKRIQPLEFRDEIIENNYFEIRLTERFVRDSLVKRIDRVSLKKCSSDFLAEVEAAKKNYFPLLWVNFRLGKRTWVSQVEGIANILKSLSENFPKLAVVFDGISKSVDINGNLAVTPHEEEGIKKEKETLSKIQSLLPQEIKVYDIIGCPVYEVVLWAHAIDLYMAPFGGGLAKVVSIANKPGVLHTNKYGVKVNNMLYSKTRENAALSVFVPEHYIVDAPNDSFTKIGEVNRSYDCDWRGIYEEVFKLASSLKSSTRT